MDEMRDKLHPGSEQPPEEQQRPDPVLEAAADSTEEEPEEGAEGEEPQIDEGEFQYFRHLSNRCLVKTHNSNPCAHCIIFKGIYTKEGEPYIKKMRKIDKM